MPGCRHSLPVRCFNPADRCEARSPTRAVIRTQSACAATPPRQDAFRPGRRLPGKGRRACAWFCAKVTPVTSEVHAAAAPPVVRALIYRWRFTAPSPRARALSLFMHRRDASMRSPPPRAQEMNARETPTTNKFTPTLAVLKICLAGSAMDGISYYKI